MRCTIPEISWHNREPVLSVDIHPVSDNFYRLASGGGDSHILIWQMTICENGAVKQEVISDLTRHQRAVNTVRWSSSGQYLASADDDANIIVWQLKTDNAPSLEGESEDKESWIVFKVLRGHKEDIYDMCWSVDDMKLFSGSVDNTAILWNLTKGKMDHILSDHKGFVQGVAWDPKGQFLATISTDRVCRLFDVSGRHVKARIHKGTLPVPPHHFLYQKESKYFHDDTFKSFFRRLEFSPDGSLLVVPSGHIQAEDCKKVLNATLVFTMDNFNEPAVVLPIPQQCSTVVRFCPILFEHRPEGQRPYVDLPYRMIFAVGTDHDVILYDTQQAVPFARFYEIHYTRLTDLAWSSDGKILIASSTDGFCALITFDADELGVPYVKEDSDRGEETIEASNEVDKELEAKKRSNFLKEWAQTTPKKVAQKRAKPAATEDIKEKINKLLPRRVKRPEVAGCGQSAKPIAVRRQPRLNEHQKPAIVEAEETSNEVDKELEAKKRSNFLKQWAQQKEPADDDLIEITDEGDLADNIKAEINKLLPRRVKHPEFGQFQTAKPIDAGAKPIAVRRQPRINENQKPVESKATPVEQVAENVETSNEVDRKRSLDRIEITDEPADNIKAETNKSIPRRLKPTKVAECSQFRKAKPIEVRRAPKDAVRKQPRTNEDQKPIESEENVDINNKVEKQLEAKKRSSFLEQWAQPTPKKNAKTPETRPKSPAEVVEITDEEDDEAAPVDSMKLVDKKLVVKISADERTRTQSAWEKKRKEEETSNFLVGTPKKAKLKPSVKKTRSAPKIKVSSLVGTKPSTPSLLKFLTKSSTTKIDLSMDGDEARDCWDDRDAKTTPVEATTEEDCTEDFCLRLEDTQGEKESPSEIETESVVVEVAEKAAAKMPRRVPLITLSSPKSGRSQSK